LARAESPIEGWLIGLFDGGLPAPLIELADPLIAQLGQPLHPTQRGEKGGRDQGGRFRIDLEVLASVVALGDPHRPIAVFGFDVPLPGVG
jgi:hypothetical protein